eukprot:SM000163S02337  [mRNA]  locus=s163:253254:254876:- [translate_table: standard]
MAARGCAGRAPAWPVRGDSLQPASTRSGAAFRCLHRAGNGSPARCHGPVGSPVAHAEQVEELPVKGRAGSPGGAAASSPSVLYSSAAMVIYALAAEGPGYSQASYYTSLGLFLLSLPGLWSLIKRSTKSKIVKKTFEVPGPKASESKPLNQIAGEITSHFTRNNYTLGRKQDDVVVFEGILTPSRSQAAFLIFCSALSLASVGLVLTITFPQVGSNWYYLTVLSPLSGIYYWTRATRKEEIKVKMVVADDEQTAHVIVQGDDEEVNRLRQELALMEKGMVYVKGLLER